MRSAVIVDAVRTASGKGKPGGALSGTHPVELLAGVLTARAKPTPSPEVAPVMMTTRPSRRKACRGSTVFLRVLAGAGP